MPIFNKIPIILYFTLFLLTPSFITPNHKRKTPRSKRKIRNNRNQRASFLRKKNSKQYTNHNLPKTDKSSVSIQENNQLKKNIKTEEISMPHENTLHHSDIKKEKDFQNQFTKSNQIKTTYDESDLKNKKIKKEDSQKNKTDEKNKNILLNKINNNIKNTKQSKINNEADKINTELKRTDSSTETINRKTQQNNEDNEDNENRQSEKITIQNQSEAKENFNFALKLKLEEDIENTWDIIREIINSNKISYLNKEEASYIYLITNYPSEDEIKIKAKDLYYKLIISTYKLAILEQKEYFITDLIKIINNDLQVQNKNYPCKIILEEAIKLIKSEQSEETITNLIKKLITDYSVQSIYDFFGVSNPKNESQLKEEEEEEAINIAKIKE